MQTHMRIHNQREDVAARTLECDPASPIGGFAENERRESVHDGEVLCMYEYVCIFCMHIDACIHIYCIRLYVCMYVCIYVYIYIIYIFGEEEDPS
jgi:hypothetical protein